MPALTEQVQEKRASSMTWVSLAHIDCEGDSMVQAKFYSADVRCHVLVGYLLQNSLFYTRLKYLILRWVQDSGLSVAFGN